MKPKNISCSLSSPPSMFAGATKQPQHCVFNVAAAMLVCLEMPCAQVLNLESMYSLSSAVHVLCKR